MDPARYAIAHPVNIWLIIVILLAGGVYAFFALGRLEDPEFTVKQAVVVTPYPGASAREVEAEVTDIVETAIQRLPQLERVTSRSMPGRSEITVTIQDRYRSPDLPQVWDELRRKVQDVQPDLPPGAAAPRVNDDFGDVFGLLYAVTAPPGYSDRELLDYAKSLRRDLLAVPEVSKITLEGEPEEEVFVEISRARLARQRIAPERIFATLEAHNLVHPAGDVRVGDERQRIVPTGATATAEAIAAIFIGPGPDGELVRLGDIATVTRGKSETPGHIVRRNGERAILLGLATDPQADVVAVGQAVEDAIDRLETRRPLGMEVHSIYAEHAVVADAVRGFLRNLAMAVGIVIVVICGAMGLRPGLIVASVLLLTISGTLFAMQIFGIEMQRVSLGALIVAMGMLVDNAIVVTEGIAVRLRQGWRRIEAASEVVRQTQWPLLGATAVGILAFAAIGLSDDVTGEYTQSLSAVILISLLLSWVLAVTLAPLFCHAYLPAPGENGAGGGASSGAEGPYDRRGYRVYRRMLAGCLRWRWISLGTVIAMTGAAAFGFTFVKHSFFPDSTTPLVFVESWRAQGSDIRAADADMRAIEDWLMEQPEVPEVTTTVGQGAPRMILQYAPELPNAAYGQTIARVTDEALIPELAERARSFLSESLPSSDGRIFRLTLGPGEGARIQARFSGTDPVVLRRLSEDAQRLMRADGGLLEIRDDWRQRAKTIVPRYAEERARPLGISREALAEALETGFSGRQVGVMRDRDELLPILIRAPDEERLRPESIQDIQVWSPLREAYVPIGQVVSGFGAGTEEMQIRRRDRMRTLTVHADVALTANVNEAFERIRPEIEAIELPVNYSLEWGGEHEDATEAQASLLRQIPPVLIAMIVIMVLLFGQVRQALIVWLCVPMAIVGVTVGLIATGLPFSFMALVGFLSLSGMLIKNAIVLIDQTDINIGSGQDRWEAVLAAGVSRLRPVVLTALTTILGMVPLLFDAFFSVMAVTIMSGLAFATLLTLILVPVLYAIFFRIQPPKPPPKPPGRKRAKLG